MSDQAFYSGAIGIDGRPIAEGGASGQGGTFALRLVGLAPATASYADRVLALSPIAYYQLSEASGTTATDSGGSGYDGSYVNAVPGGAGIGDGQTGATFDGTGDAVNIAAMLPSFDPDVGTIVAWGETAAWADSTTRYLVRLAGDTDDQFVIAKSNTLNQLRFARHANSITQGAVVVTSTALAGSAAYFCAALTWSVADNALKAYINGAQVGTTQTGLDAFDTPIDASFTAIGANGSGGAASWSGQIAHVAIFDRALSDAEILSLGVL